MKDETPLVLKLMRWYMLLLCIAGILIECYSMLKKVIITGGDWEFSIVTIAVLIFFFIVIKKGL